MGSPEYNHACRGIYDPVVDGDDHTCLLVRHKLVLKLGECHIPSLLKTSKQFSMRNSEWILPSYNEEIFHIVVSDLGFTYK